MKVFDDGVLEPHEQKELRELYGMGKLTLPDVRLVFGMFLRDTWDAAMADGILTEDEKTKLANIVAQLKLPVDLVPENVRRALGK
jgi:tellurite resistance protein